MRSFAFVADYERRYGPVDDTERIGAFLEDASVFIASQPGFSPCEGNEAMAAALNAITCSLVNRKVTAGEYAGLSQMSQGAGGYTASVSVYNPSGDYYLTKQERRVLGLAGGRVGMTDPYRGGAA